MSKTKARFFLVIISFIVFGFPLIGQNSTLAESILVLEKVLKEYSSDPGQVFGQVKREFDAEVMAQKLEEARKALDEQRIDDCWKLVDELSAIFKEKGFSSEKPIRLSRYVSSFDRRGVLVVTGQVKNFGPKDYETLIELRVLGHSSELLDRMTVSPLSGSVVPAWGDASFKAYFYYPPLSSSISTIEVRIR
ncbi:MAG: hypothetical protein PHQ23_07535 [Candidatus Wallbacteria bacterium]|nr:hypothetical protein [Candidatus Wallbacteria bacterium]